MNVLPYKTTFVKGSLPSWLQDHFGALEEGGSKLSEKQLWEQVGWLRRCIELRALAVATMPYVVEARGAEVYDSDTGEAPDGFDFLADLPDYFYRAEASLSMVGAAYALMVTEAPLRLQWFNPTTIKPVYRADGLDYFERRYATPGGGQRVERYAPDVVLHTFTGDPFRESGPGASLLHAARQDVEVLRSLTLFLDNFLDRGLVKATLLVIPKHTSPDERKRLKRWWNMRFKGKNVHEADVVSEDVKPVVIGEGLSDLADTDLTNQQRQALSATFGIPESMLLSSAANYATKRGDQLDFYRWTVMPSAERVARTLNRQFLVRFGLRLRLQPERLEVVQEAQLDEAKALVGLTGGPILTPNEARERIGLDPVPGGDEFRMTQATFAGLGGRGLTDAQQEEAKQWRRKVERVGRDAPFDTKALSGDQGAAIRARLATSMPLDEVFSPPYANF